MFSSVQLLSHVRLFATSWTAAHQASLFITNSQNPHHIIIHSSVKGLLGCFHVLAIVNGTVMNTGVHVSFWVTDFLGYMLCVRIAGSYGNSMYNFLSYHHTVLHCGCTNLHSTIECNNSTNNIREFLFLHTRGSIYGL